MLDGGNVVVVVEPTIKQNIEITKQQARKQQSNEKSTPCQLCIEETHSIHGDRVIIY